MAYHPVSGIFQTVEAVIISSVILLKYFKYSAVFRVEVIFPNGVWRSNRSKGVDPNIPITVNIDRHDNFEVLKELL